MTATADTFIVCHSDDAEDVEVVNINPAATVPAPILGRALANVALAADIGKHARPQLAHVELYWSRTAGISTIRLTATDSYVMIRETVPCGPYADGDDGAGPDDEWTVYLPAALLGPIVRATRRKANRQATAVLRFRPYGAEGLWVQFEIGDEVLQAGTTDCGGWPNLDLVISQHRPGSVDHMGLNPHLLARLARVDAGGPSGPGSVPKPMRFTFHKSTAAVRVDWTVDYSGGELFALIMPVRIP